MPDSHDDVTPCYFPNLAPILKETQPHANEQYDAPDPTVPNMEDRTGTPPGKPPGVGPHDGPEKLGLMFLAMRDGVHATARAHGVPRRTLAHWFGEYGTLEAVQAWLRAETQGAFLRAEQSIYRELETRLPSWPNDELGMTVRALVNARALVPAQAAAAQAAAQPPAVAAAQATVTVKVEGKDGEAKIIDLGPPPEETE